MGQFTLSGLMVASGRVNSSRGHGYIPVSYTHLDVYKRQGMSEIRGRCGESVAFGRMLRARLMAFANRIRAQRCISSGPTTEQC